MTLAFLLSALLALQAQPQTAAQAGDQDAAAPIEAVTVFQRGAQVTRQADVRVPAGTTRLRFAGLASDLDPESVQFSATGAVTVLSVVHRQNFLEEAGTSEEAARLRAIKEALQDSLRAEEMLLDVYEQEEALLLKNTAIGGVENGVDVGELRAAADFLRTRLTEIKRRQRAIQQAIRRLQEALAEVDNQLGEIAAERPDRATSEVTATLTAAAPVESAVAAALPHAGGRLGAPLRRPRRGGRPARRARLQRERLAAHGRGLDGRPPHALHRRPRPARHHPPRCNRGGSASTAPARPGPDVRPRPSPARPSRTRSGSPGASPTSVPATRSPA